MLTITTETTETTIESKKAPDTFTLLCLTFGKRSMQVIDGVMTPADGFK